MPFNIIAWGYGFILNELSKRVLANLTSPSLSKDLEKEMKEWANELPEDERVPIEHIFGASEREPTPDTHPARFRLQEVLQTQGIIPTQQEWIDAFEEHWHARRTELGVQANVFFSLSPDRAHEHLKNLAYRIHRRCQADPELARRTITTQLSQVLAKQQEEQEARLKITNLPYFVRSLTTNAINIYLEKPTAWEYRLFAQVFEDEIALHASSKRDFDSGIVWGEFVDLQEPHNLFKWLRTHLNEARMFGPNIENILNEALPVAFGELGVSGDAEAIIDVASKMGEVYRRAIEWALKLRRLHANVEFEKIITLTETLVHDIIQQIEEFSEVISNEIKQCIEEDFSIPKQKHLKLVLTVPEGVAEGIEKEIQRLSHIFPIY
jgi:hypothetical protein